MNRCARRPLGTRGLALSVALTCAFALLPSFGHAQQRGFPDHALRGLLVVGNPPAITLNGSTLKSVPGNNLTLGNASVADNTPAGLKRFTDAYVAALSSGPRREVRGSVDLYPAKDNGYWYSGNLDALVAPVVALISAVLWLVTDAPMLTHEKAQHVLDSHQLLGPTLLFAAVTGLLLFASSIVAGWVENWFVLHKLDSAIAYNPTITRRLGQRLALRCSHFMRTHVSGLAANISLGLMLGLVPVIALFFGLSLDVRHVTLTAGQIAAAAFTLGLPALSTPAFAWALAGLAVALGAFAAHGLVKGAFIATEAAGSLALYISKAATFQPFGALPLDIQIRTEADSGAPTVVADPDGRIASIYKQIARKVAVRIAERSKDMTHKFPNIVFKSA